MPTIWCIPTYNRQSEAHALWRVIADSPGWCHIPIVIDTKEAGWSLSRAWNESISIAQRLSRYAEQMRVVLINDDIEITQEVPSWMDSMIDEHSGKVVMLHGFSLVGASLDTFLKVGKFDERFYPAYYEDNDYSRRCEGMGVELVALQREGVLHGGSQTIAKMSKQDRAQFDRQFVQCREYYVSKWGGLPGQETVAAGAYNGQNLFL